MRHTFLMTILLGVFVIGSPPVRAEEPHVIRISMTADAEGGLAELALDGDTIARPKDGKRTRLDVLHSRIRSLDERSMGRRDFEAELRCDKNLQYRHVIEVITAISGYRANPSDKKVVVLIEKIKFAQPRR